MLGTEGPCKSRQVPCWCFWAVLGCSWRLCGGSWGPPGVFLGPPGALPAAFWVPLEGQEALLDAKTRRSTGHRKTHGFTWFLRGFGASRTSPGVPKRLWNGPCWVHKARLRVHKDHVGVHKAQVGYTRPFWKATCAICTALPTLSGLSGRNGPHATQVGPGTKTVYATIHLISTT